MKIIRWMTIPAIVLLSACGDGSGGDVPELERPGTGAPALNDETPGQPSEPTATPPGSEPAPGREPGVEADPGGEPATEPETGTATDPVDEPETAPETETETDSGNDPDPGNESEPGNGSGTDPESESGSEPGSGSSPTAENPSVSDPMTRNVTSVTFEITVPAYVSNELQVRIAWGETTLAAVWNGDESWIAVADLPTDEERLLIVDFQDRNGDITLGTFERDFGTGTNAAETYTIGPENFDTDRWDSDRDGVSDIDELRSGTDPSVTDTPFGLVEGPPDEEGGTPLGIIERVSALFESSLPKTRPYIDSAETRPAGDADFLSFRVTQVTDIDIDASGTGTFSSFVETRNTGNEDIRRSTREATRTVGDGIEWRGTWKWSVSSAGLSEDFTFDTVTRAVGERIVQSGKIERDATLFGRQGKTDIEYEFVGERIPGTPLCEPVSGRAVVYERTGLYFDDPGDYPTSTTISREPTGRIWTINTRYADGTLQGRGVESLGIELYCEFGEL